MSPRAAWRLESLGFREVYDYVAGEADWFASGLPREGKAAAVLQLGDILRRDVPTCRPGDRVGDVRARLQATGWDVCVIVNERGVVLGVHRHKALEADADAAIESVMNPGPATYRPNLPVRDLLDAMPARDLHGSSLVTTPRGVLLGTVSRDQAEQAVGGSGDPPEAPGPG